MSKILICIIIILLISIYHEEKVNGKILQHFENEKNLQDEIFDGLSYLHLLLNKYDIKHWLCYGSLLGAVRDNDIIKHDCNFDIGCFFDDAQKIYELNSLIKKDGYEIKYATAYCYDKFKNDTTDKAIWKAGFKLTKNNKILGDIFLYTAFSDGMIRRYDPQSSLLFIPEYIMPYWFIETLSDVTIRNKTFQAPRDPKILLEYWYGKNWQVPTDTGRCLDGITNIKETHPDFDVFGNAKGMDIKKLQKYVSDKSVSNDLYRKFKKWNGVKDVRYVFMKKHLDWIKDNDR